MIRENGTGGSSVDSKSCGSRVGDDCLMMMGNLMKGDLMALILKTVLATLLNELKEAVVGSQVKKVLKWLQDCRELTCCSQRPEDPRPSKSPSNHIRCIAGIYSRQC